MLDTLELTYIRYRGGIIAPRGSYLNPRNFTIVQLYEESQLPIGDIFLRVDPDPAQTPAKIAVKLNELLGEAFKASDFKVIKEGVPAKTTPTQKGKVNSKPSKWKKK